MIKGATIARRSDGFFLCEYFDKEGDEFKLLRNHVKKVIKNDNMRNGGADFVELNPQYYITLLQKEGILLSIVCTSSYPKKLAKACSIEVGNKFLDHVQDTFGSGGVDCRSKIETIREPYPFVGFDRQIARTIEKYRDTDSDENIHKMNSDLFSIQDSLTESLSLLMDKDNKINDMLAGATQLNSDAGRFKNQAIKVRLTLQMRNYLLFGIIGVLILMFVYLKFF